ncbi:MAG: hemerythrin domain-containing protein [Candidatus Thermoplasmatota archaeon]|jgi:hemerythrin-like domain-containing protein|nr:hemerythrin domain-containing protein [Candidatus Thermoplasmatota archaeon]MDP7264732.1 hemerythrin domain-containing protein [Candidatus Thermoplasmatota archaeon]
MEEYLNRGIKEIIKEFPKIGEILDGYGIGCAPCSVGTCLLKDIVEIHDLSPEDEQEMMGRIAGIIYPDRKMEIPLRKKKTHTNKEIKYSPPLKKLVDEHRLIKRWVALIPGIIKKVDVERADDRTLVLSGVEFIQQYADRYHHAKEEDILFKYFDEEQDVIKAMLEDHKKARSHVRALLKGLEERNNAAVKEHLRAYAELLTEHIKKEDEILYPWMDRQLTIGQIGTLFTKFGEVDMKHQDLHKNYEKIIDRFVTE